MLKRVVLAIIFGFIKCCHLLSMELPPSHYIVFTCEVRKNDQQKPIYVAYRNGEPKTYKTLLQNENGAWYWQNTSVDDIRATHKILKDSFSLLITRVDFFLVHQKQKFVRVVNSKYKLACNYNNARIFDSTDTPFRYWKQDLSLLRSNGDRSSSLIVSAMNGQEKKLFDDLIHETLSKK